jgi:hypothetical protein
MLLPLCVRFYHRKKNNVKQSSNSALKEFSFKRGNVLIVI